LYRAGKVLGKQDWLEWVKAQYDAFLAEDGTIKEYRIDEYSLDQ
jgi:unsaturated rhamnogalacturonyl hydrolase